MRVPIFTPAVAYLFAIGLLAPGHPAAAHPGARGQTKTSTYCGQTLPTSVPGCQPVLSVSDVTLATGTWDTTDIPRSGSLPTAGTTVGLYIYSHGVGIGTSIFSAQTQYGLLCLASFKRSAPACAPLVISHPTWTPGAGACTSTAASLAANCNAGALGLAVGDDVNIQFWYRDPYLPSGSGAARLSFAAFYTLQ